METAVTSRAFRRTLPLLALVLIALCGLTSCAAAGGSARPASRTTVTVASTTACRPRAPSHPVAATRVPGVATDWTVTSFDGTKIRAHWFPVSADGSKRSPTILMGPGWSEDGATDPSSPQLFGGLSIDVMRRAGFNMLTWDPRGFGHSTGQVELDSPDYEARDVQQLITWLATLPGVQVNGPDDPAVGMVGGSYGGGIQFTSAAIDCRIDAIVPTIAWHSLATSLYPNDTVKSGWSNLLIQGASVTGMRLDPHIVASESSITTGVIDAAEQRFFTSAGVGDDISKVDAPTLIIQGVVDDLFPLEEGVTNYLALRARGVPTAMIWFCGGHGVCLTPAGNQQSITQATLAWLDRYVRREKRVVTGPGFTFIDQNGVSYTAPQYPIPVEAPITADGSGTLTLTGAGGSGPAHPPRNSPDPLAAIGGRVAPAFAAHAVNVDVVATRSELVVGAPQLTLTYQGQAGPGTAPERVFAQVVDAGTGLVLGNQITPVDVTLDGRTHTTSVPLELVVAALHPGAHLTLQLVATTVAFTQPRLGGSVTFERIHLALPVSSTIKPR